MDLSNGYDQTGVSDRIVIRKDVSEKYVGTLKLTDQAVSKPFTGIVVGIGPGSQRPGRGSKLDMSELKVGDRVLFENHVGFNYKLYEESYLSIPITSISAIIPVDLTVSKA